LSDATQEKLAKRIRRGRAVAAFGMLGLCVSFFVPQVQHPDAVFFNLLLSEEKGARFCLPFFFAAAMLVFYGTRAALRNEKFRRGLAHAACLVCFALLFVGDLALWWEAAQGPTAPEWWLHVLLWTVVGGLAAATVGVLALWAAAPEEARVAACVAVAGFCSLGYFGVFLAIALHYNFVITGLWLSLAASALVTLGGLWETLAAWKAHRVAAGTPASSIPSPPAGGRGSG
jgi:hypothetical protein